MICTDPDGKTVYSWHTIILDTMTGPLARTCELRAVKESHNTLDVELGIR